MGRVPAAVLLAAVVALPCVTAADTRRARRGPVPLWYYDQKSHRCACCTTRDEAIAGLARKGGCKIGDVDVRSLKKGADSLHVLHCRKRVTILAGRKWACNYLRSHAAALMQGPGDDRVRSRRPGSRHPDAPAPIMVAPCPTTWSAR